MRWILLSLLFLQGCGQGEGVRLKLLFPPSFEPHSARRQRLYERAIRIGVKLLDGNKTIREENIPLVGNSSQLVIGAFPPFEKNLELRVEFWDRIPRGGERSYPAFIGKRTLSPQEVREHLRQELHIQMQSQVKTEEYD